MSTLPSQRFDVIVVGAGPAGVTAAVALAKTGFSVLLCEAAVFPGAENWSGAVYFAENVERPEAFGQQVIDEAPYERRLVERGAYLYNGHGLLGASLRSTDAFRSCYTVLRPVYDRYLAEVAREHGVLLSCETTVQSLIRHHGRVVGVHTERGPAYADVVFLAEGDASHLVTQEGYETVSDEEREHGAPHFLQGVKEVISLPRDVLERRFGLTGNDGVAFEMLLRNATRRGKTVRLNMGGFVYTNRESISLGFVLPLDNLKHEFEGSHNLLMEWFKGLPEVAAMIEGGELTSYGAKIIRGGGLREIPRLVDDGLAIGGAASGIGLDFPYPNFTGPATAMGLYFADAVQRIAADNGGPGAARSVGDSPYSAEALSRSYLKSLQASHYYRNVEYLRDWPDYIERSQFFFERQLDLANHSAFVLSRPQQGVFARVGSWLRLLRTQLGDGGLGLVRADTKVLAATVGVAGLVRAAITPANVARVFWNTLTAPFAALSSRSRLRNVDAAGAEGAGLAEATAHDGARLRGVYRVDAGAIDAGRAPLLFRWYWKRFGPAVASAFSEVYTNDDADIGDKLRAAARHIGGAASLWDLLVGPLVLLGVVVGIGAQRLLDTIRTVVFRWDAARLRDRPVTQTVAAARQRIRLDESCVHGTTTYEAKLGTITYHEGSDSHIKVMWPKQIEKRLDLSASPLWNICPAKVYEVRRNAAGHPGVVVNFDNCIKCETCWRATDDVHWSRATQQRLVYETYTPAQFELHDYLDGRPEPRARLDTRAGFFDALGEGLAADADPEGADNRMAVGIWLERTRVALRMYGEDLRRSPLALEEGRRNHLRRLLGASRQPFERASSAWDDEALAETRRLGGGLVEGLWEDARRCFDEMTAHARTRRFFWADVYAKQLLDHHFPGIEQFCAGFDAAASSRNGSTVRADWQRAVAWRSVETAPVPFEAIRSEITDSCAAIFDNHAIRALEHGGALTDEQVAWLRQQILAATGERIGYGRRDVLLEQLAEVDPALAYLAAAHLLAADVMAEATDVEVGTTAAVVVGSIDAATTGEGYLLNGHADFVPTALAEAFAVVAGETVFLVQGDAMGVSLEDVGTIGLIGARVRRLRLTDVVVGPAQSSPLGRVDAVRLTAPQAGQPLAPVLEAAVGDALAIVRGAGAYLLDRARDHAAGRVQFPGTFEDESGRDGIAKFGAVKQMLAEMEAHRYVLEAVSMAPASADPWIAAAAAKVMASEAFGPGPGSFTYNAGQLFGGTAFSEDDDIAKYYRDSGPFRFLWGHDDALRAEIGRRCLSGESELLALSDDDAAWLARAAEHELLTTTAARYRESEARLRDEATAVGSADDALATWVAGAAIVRVLAARAVLLRAVRRLDAGLAGEVVAEAAKLVVDRLAAELPGLIEEAQLAAQSLAAGDDFVANGEPFPAPQIAAAQDYAAIAAVDQPHGSGEWLMRTFDPSNVRYVPEILANDERLRSDWRELEAEFRGRYTEPRFDGLIYSRYLEKLHLIPQVDLDYMVERGFMRMPIAAELGGEAAFKAQYYILCMLIGRYGDAALSLAIMANTSIGTTPTQIGLYQDLPRARAELERVREDPRHLGDVHDRLEALLGLVTARADLDTLTAAYKDLAGLVRTRVGKSMVLKYIGAGFLRAFNGAGRAARARNLEGFEAGLRKALAGIDGILQAVDRRLIEYPRRQHAHEQFLRMISAGYISAFALTEPTAGSDSGGVKTLARAERRRVHRDDDGVLWFWLDEDNARDRRNLLDDSRLEFDYEGHRLLYRYDDDRDAAVIDHSEYDYDKDLADRMRFYLHGDRKVPFADIAQIREDAEGHPVYEFWVLNGAKMWITNGRFSHCMALYACTDPEGVTGFMVDRHAEGLVVGADEEKLGQRGSPTNELSLNNVRVPREAIIGFRGRGQVNALETLNTGRAGLCVTTHATIQEMVEDALPYVRGEMHPAFDHVPPAASRPLERYWLGRVAEEVIGTAGTTYELIGLLDNKKTASVRMESATGKYYGTEAQHEAIDWMERLRGLEGQTWLHRIEKTRRDARVLNIYEGTNEVQRFLLLKDLVQRVLPAWHERGEAGALPESIAHSDLARELESIKERLNERLQASVDRFGQLVWANVGMQPCFFRLAELAGLAKVIDAVLYRLEWLARHDAPADYTERVTTLGRRYVSRALARARTLERRFDLAYADLEMGRYPADVHLGFLSLEETGAAAQGWGRGVESAIVPTAAVPLPRPIRVVVLLRSVPASAPRPRVAADGEFAEPLTVLNAADSAALESALQLQRRDPAAVTVVVASVSASSSDAVLREGLARGADAAVQLRCADAAYRYDGRYVAEAVAGWLAREPADLVLCGDRAADSVHAGVAGYLGGRLDWPQYEGVASVGWSDSVEPELRIEADGWSAPLRSSLPSVCSVSADEHLRGVYDLPGLLRAEAHDITILSAAELVGRLDPIAVRHAARSAGSEQAAAVVDSPEAAADLVLRVAADAGGSGASGAPAYSPRMLGLGEQTPDDTPSFVYLADVAVAGELAASTAADLDTVRALARHADLPLHVVVPVDGGEPEAAQAVGAVLATGEAARVYAVAIPGVAHFGVVGNVEWLEEFWAMLRGRPEWLVGASTTSGLLARFIGRGTPETESGRCWSWYGADAIRNGGDTVWVATGMYSGAVRAEAALPAQGGMRVLTLGRSVDLDFEASAGSVPTDTAEVFCWQPQLQYDPLDDPLAVILSRAEERGDSLADAEFIIDFGYGAGGREGLDELAEPLRRLLADELGLDKVMVGATRKVTQDLELLPADRQIGQTGVSVNPRLILALAVSGAPQHIDYVGERAEIISFNTDPDAPLMRLNDHRARPLVHPIVGDVRETVPRFIAELRRRRDARK